MSARLLLLFLVPTVAMAVDGSVPDSELSLGGVAIGQSPVAVVAMLGEPLRKEEMPDFIDLDYYYSQVRVSFNTGTVAGLRSEDPKTCTPRGLCPGDGFDKMKLLYGVPKVSERESGRFYEYYGSDGACWLEIPAKGKEVASLSVVCMP